MNVYTNFVNNLFGTIAGNGIFSKIDSNISFIPADSGGNTIIIKGDTATWLGLKNPLQQKYAYDNCFPVASVVDKLAEFDLTGSVEILRAKGKGKNDYATGEWATKINARLLKPNPLQSWEQFRGQQIAYKKIFGYCPVLPIIPAGFESSPENCSSIINLPPWLFDAVPTGKIIYQSKIEDIVKEYTCTILNSTITFKPTDLFILEDSFMQRDDFMLPQSRLVGLDMAVSNICYAMEADNVLLKKKGPLGFIAHDAGAVKDSVAGYIPMSQKEKQDLQDDLHKYGMTLAQYQYVISRTAAKWNPMSFNVRELMTKETIVAGERAICHRYNFPYVLYEEQDATYANSSSASKAVYQNNVIPNNTKDIAKYNIFFKAAENSAIIKVDYSELPVLQEDKLLQAQAANTQNDAYLKEYENNIITLNKWRELRGYDKVDGDDLYYRDVKQSTPVIEETTEDTLAEEKLKIAK